MLQNIRDRSQGWIAWIVVGLICLTFILWGVHSYLDNTGSNDTIAKINGERISQSQLQPVYERIKQQQQLQLGSDVSFDQSAERQLKEKALNQIIISRVLSDAAIKQGFRVTSEQVKAALLNIPAFQINGQFSRERFLEVTRSLLYNQQDFLTDMRTAMLINQVRGGFINTEFALPNEISNAIKLINQKRDIAYAILPFKLSLANNIISDEQAQSYYRQHLNAYSVPEQVRLDYVVLSLSELTKQIKISTTEVVEYYKSNLAKFTKNANVAAFTQVQEQARKELLKVKTEHLFTELSDRMSNLAFANPNSLINLAKELDLPLMNTSFFSKQGGKDKLTSNAKIIAAAFSPEVLEQGNNSDVIEYEPGKIIVMRIKQHKAASTLPFAKVKASIIDQLRINAAKQQIEQFGSKLVDQYNHGDFNNPLVKRYALTWQKAIGISRFDQRLNPLILQKAFSLPYARIVHNPYTGIRLANGDYALIKLVAIHDGNSQTISPIAKRIFAERIEDNLGQLDYALYIHSLLNKAKIKLFTRH